jgi:outer membrane receptor protein involved in Fe transport
MNRNFNTTLNKYDTLLYTHEYQKPIFVPQLAIIYKLNTNNILKLLYGQGYSRPSIGENSFTLNTVHSMLEPQTIATSEIYYSFVAKKYYLFSTSIYYNQLDKLISRLYSFDNAGKIIIDNQNSGTMNTIGTEISLKYINNKIINFDASVSYQHTTDYQVKKLYNPATQSVIDSSFRIKGAYAPVLLAYFNISWNASHNIIAALSANYVSQISSWDNVNKVEFSEPVPSYLNITANLRFHNLFKTGLYLSLHAINLLNSKIRYAPTSAKAGVFKDGTVETGTEVIINMGIKF